MATKKPGAKGVDPARLDAITRAIADELSPFRHTMSDLDDAKSATADAKALQDGVDATHVNAREGVMQKLAKLSLAGSWTNAEIKLAASAAAKGNALKADKAIETFVGEAKMVMDPLICEHFDNMLRLRDCTWEAEQEARAIDKNAPMPIKKAFARKYHYLMAVVREAREQETCPDTIDELVEFAQAKDPDLDAGKIKRRLDKIISDLLSFHGDFPDSNIDACLGFLNEITEDHLVAARNDKLGVVPEVASTPVVAPKPTSQTAIRKALEIEKAAEIAGISAGAVDIDDLMSTYDGGSVALSVAA